MKVAIYPNEETVSILTPVQESFYSAEEIFDKDVPTGVPYLILDSSEIPTDREFRNAWEADFSNPDGYGA